MLWQGVRLLEMLDDIIDGKCTGFEGDHDIAPPLPCPPSLYPDPYHNYFCEKGKDGFLLVLHPDVKPFAEALRKPSVMKHCWFDSNSDPVISITAAAVAERVNPQARESILSKGWIDASGKVWESKDIALKTVFGGVCKLLDLKEIEQSDDLLDDAAFGAMKKRLVTRVNESKASDDWIRTGIVDFDPDAAPSTGIARKELSELLVEQLMHETSDDSGAKRRRVE